MKRYFIRHIVILNRPFRNVHAVEAHTVHEAISTAIRKVKGLTLESIVAIWEDGEKPE